MPNKKVNLRELFYRLILLFPITTLTQYFFGIINTVLFSVVFILLIYLLLRTPMKKKYFFLFSIVVINHAISLSYTNFSGINNKNTLYYFLFWILFSSFVCIDKNNLILFLKKNKKYVCSTVKVSLFIMGISVFVPMSYSSGYFKSFSGSSARVCAVATMMTTMLTLLIRIYGKKEYGKYVIIPLYCVVMGDSRTYLVVTVALFLLFLWNYFENKKKFYYSLIPVAFLMVVVIFSTNIYDKILSNFDQNNPYFDALGMFTSGRSVFWYDMLDAYWKTGWVHRIWGDGFHFVYTIRKFWAHNDFIQLLLTFGFVGLATYLWSVQNLIRTYIGNDKSAKKMLILVYIIWLFNAFFNMFYVYMCAAISFPFLLISLTYDQNSLKLLEVR